MLPASTVRCNVSFALLATARKNSSASSWSKPPVKPEGSSASKAVCGRPEMSSVQLAEEFFRAVANSAKLTLHLTVEAGSNAHHVIEALFKAFARALRAAVAIDPTETGVPSTKGTLTA